MGPREWVPWDGSQGMGPRGWDPGNGTQGMGQGMGPRGWDPGDGTQGMGPRGWDPGDGSQGMGPMGWDPGDWGKKFRGVVGQYLWVTEQMERRHVSAVSGSYVEDSVQWYLFCEVPCHIVESRIKKRDLDFFVFIYGLGSYYALMPRIMSL